MHPHIQVTPTFTKSMLSQLTLLLLLLLNKSYLFVYVIARAGRKFGINFTSYSENGNFAIMAKISQNSLLPLLSQINTKAT